MITFLIGIIAGSLSSYFFFDVNPEITLIVLLSQLATVAMLYVFGLIKT